jgi:hypothetical protein
MQPYQCFYRLDYTTAEKGLLCSIEQRFKLYYYDTIIKLAQL